MAAGINWLPVWAYLSGLVFPGSETGLHGTAKQHELCVGLGPSDPQE